MQLTYYTQWEVVSYVQLILFLIYFVEFAISIFYKLNHRNGLRAILPFFGFFSVFLLFKVVGGIIGLVFMHQSTFNLNLFIPTYIFDSISLGFITRSISSLIQHMLNQQNPEHSQLDQLQSNMEYKADDGELAVENTKPQFAKKFWPFRLVTLILLAAVVLSIVGTSQASETSPPSSVGTLLKVSSVLFLVGIVLMIGILLFILSNDMQFNIIAKLLILSLVILIVRCIYSIISSFHGIDFGEPSKYMILFGNYKYYTFLGLLSEALASIIVLIAFWYW